MSSPLNSSIPHKEVQFVGSPLQVTKPQLILLIQLLEDGGHYVPDQLRQQVDEEWVDSHEVRKVLAWHSFTQEDFDDANPELLRMLQEPT